MTNPVLFIETPRAGKHNHRFIAPEGYTGGDGALSQWADFARQQTEGTEYFSANKEVTQQTGGRTGVEQLILAGVDAQRLSKQKIETIRAFLQQRLPDVERLVTRSIDWDKQAKNIVLRTELNEWQQELVQRLGSELPAAPTKPVEQSKSKRGWFVVDYWQVVTLVVFLLVGTAVIKYVKDGTLDYTIHDTYNYSRTPASGRSSTTIPNNTELQKAKDQMERLVAAIGGKKNEPVQKEIVTKYGSPSTEYKSKNLLGVITTTETVSGNWTSGLGSKIPEQGKPWPLDRFTSDNELAAGLWGQPLNKLQIANGPGSLQPLVQCRNAIRNLMGVSGEVYTPFFEAGDFGEGTNQFGALHESVKGLASLDLNKGAILKNCSNDLIPPETDLIGWINKCLGEIDTTIREFKPLKPIKDFAVACENGKVKFETQPTTQH